MYQTSVVIMRQLKNNLIHLLNLKPKFNELLIMGVEK